MKAIKGVSGIFLTSLLLLSCNTNKHPPSIVDQEFNIREYDGGEYYYYYYH